MGQINNTTAEINTILGSVSGKQATSEKNQPNGYAGLDANGDLVGNIIPRTDTLANLLTVVGTAGELASATDQPAIVKYAGTVAGGDVFYKAYEKYLGEPTAVVLQTIGMTASATMLDSCLGYSLTPVEFLLAKQIAASTSFKYTYKGDVWLNSGAAPVTCNYADIGVATNYVVAIPTATTTTSYWSADLGVTWTAHATALTSATKVFGAPSVCSGIHCVTVSSGSNESALIKNDGTVTLLTMPSSQAWTTVRAPKFVSEKIQAFGMSFVASSASVAVLAGGSASPAWAAANLPVAPVSSITAFTKNLVLVIDTASTTAYLAGYDRDTGLTTSWQSVTLPFSVSSSNFFTANENYFFVASSTSSGVRRSKDGVNWETVVISSPNAAISQILATESALLVRNGPSTEIISSDNSAFGNYRRTETGAVVLTQAPGGFVGAFGTTSKLLAMNGVRQLPNQDTGATVTTSATTFSMASAVPSFNRCLKVTTTASTFTALTLPIPFENLHEVIVNFTNAQTNIVFTPATVPAGATINGGASATLSVTAGQTLRFRFVANGSFSGDWWVA